MCSLPTLAGGWSEIECTRGSRIDFFDPGWTWDTPPSEVFSHPRTPPPLPATSRRLELAVTHFGPRSTHIGLETPEALLDTDRPLPEVAGFEVFPTGRF